MAVQVDRADAPLEIDEDLDIPVDGAGWVLVAVEPMHYLINADAIFANTTLRTIPALKAAVCVRLAEETLGEDISMRRAFRSLATARAGRVGRGAPRGLQQFWAPLSQNCPRQGRAGAENRRKGRFASW